LDAYEDPINIALESGLIDALVREIVTGFCERGAIKLVIQ